MALHKTVRTAMKWISALDVDVRLTYKAERGLERIGALFANRPPAYRMHDREILCDDHLVPVRIFLPPGEGSFPTMLFFHGGGWVTGGIENYTGLCTQLAEQTGCRVASVDYRLAPEHPFPAGLMDCYAVAQAFFSYGLEDTDPNNLILVGDSAGGNLAAAVSLMARDRGEFLPRQQILLYPATAADHNMETSPFLSVRENGTDFILTSQRVERLMEMYASNPTDFTNPYFAPLLAKDFTGLPRTLILTAEFDPLRDEGEAYGEKLREACCNVEIVRIADAIHAFLMGPASPQTEEAYDAIRRFLAKRFA